MEILKYNGLVKSIGVCNFNVEQLLRIVTEAVTVPVVNQVNSTNIVLTTFLACLFSL